MGDGATYVYWTRDALLIRDSRYGHAIVHKIEQSPSDSFLETAQRWWAALDEVSRLNRGGLWRPRVYRAPRRSIWRRLFGGQ